MEKVKSRIEEKGVRLDVKNVTKDFHFGSLRQFDLMEKIKGLISQGTYYIRMQDGKIVMPFNAVSPEGHGWLYSHLDNSRTCTINTQVLFNLCKVLPTQCINCWKVVVEPRTVKELVQLFVLQRFHWKKACKCGTEHRSITTRPYGGYFYNNSYEDGLQCLDDIKSLVGDKISKNIPVTLKRGCTEMELFFGESSEWGNIRKQGFRVDKQTKNKVPVVNENASKTWEHIVYSAFELPGEGDLVQPDWMVPNWVSKWLLFAWQRGDMTMKEFNDGDSFYTPSKTYTREDSNHDK